MTDSYLLSNMTCNVNHTNEKDVSRCIQDSDALRRRLSGQCDNLQTCNTATKAKQKCFSSTHKHLAIPNFHCEFFPINIECSKTNQFTSTISTFKTYQIKHLFKNQRIFFKIVLLLIIFSQTVSASSLRKTEVVTSQNGQTNLNAHRYKDESPLISLPDIRHETKTPPQNYKILERIFARKRRSPDDFEMTCMEPYLTLYKLINHAYTTTRSANSPRRRRRSPVKRVNSSRSPGARYHKIHEMLRKMFCEIGFRSSMFEKKSRSNIQNSLETMMNILQQKMNEHNFTAFTEPDSETCDISSYQPSAKDIDIALGMEDKLHTMQAEILSLCRMNN